MIQNIDEIPDRQSNTSNHNNIEIRVFESQQAKQFNPFSVIRAQTLNLLGTGIFVDDQFKLNPNNQNNGLTIKRLSAIYPVKTPLFIDYKTGKNLSNVTKGKINPSTPAYLSELNMLPFQHYRNLIEPNYISEKGFYHVVMWKEGIMTKEFIDDTMYYDEKLGKVAAHPLLENHPWIYILLKAWAKKNKSYEASQKCSGFEFLKAFSYPDWQLINPSHEKQQYLNQRLANATNKTQFMICKTRSDPNVGYFGFTPNCASFIIRRHYQEYGQIFIIIQPFVCDQWNSLFCVKTSNFPEQPPMLHGNQFIMPLSEFLNVFHLIYTTSNKYTQKNLTSSSVVPKNDRICYEKYILNIDARDTKAIVLGFELTDNQHTGKQIPMSLNFYFPSIKIFDLVNQPRHGFHMPGDLVVPWAKIIIAQFLESGNAEASYVQSVKQKILDYGENLIGFVSYNPLYEFVTGQYFHGYNNQLTFNLSLKPGKYYIRTKIEQKQAEYRCHINATAINGLLKLFDPKITDSQQNTMLKDCLISKAKKQKKFITYVNPIKKGSWIICRNQFDTIGYGYIVVQAIKNSQNIVQVTIDPKRLKEHGYQIKGNKDQNQSKIKVNSQQNAIIILKYDKQWKKLQQRIWPPPGIQYTRIPKKPYSS